MRLVVAARPDNLRLDLIQLVASRHHLRRKTMNQKPVLTHAMLWAAAIVASATVGAPGFLSLILLPCLATISLLVIRNNTRC